MGDLRSTLDRIKNINGIVTEDYDVVSLVNDYRVYWRPKTVRVLLLAESHVYTTAQETVQYTLPPGIKPLNGLPDRFVRFVYCPAYGEDILPNGFNGSNSGTWQYWKIFYSCIHHTETHNDFYPVLKGGTPNLLQRINNKISVLESMRREGIWLVDSCITALYRQGKTKYANPLLKKAIELSWHGYVKYIVADANPKYIVVIGTSIGDILYDFLNNCYKGRYEVKHQPQYRDSRISKEQRKEQQLKLVRSYWCTCKNV